MLELCVIAEQKYGFVTFDMVLVAEIVLQVRVSTYV